MLWCGKLMINNKNIELRALSSHLFWDVDLSKMDTNRSKKLIVQRVLDYGLINDWYTLLKIYNIAEIAEIAVTIKDLDKKSASFIAFLSQVPKENFLCFTSTPSIHEHLNFW